MILGLTLSFGDKVWGKTLSGSFPKNFAKLDPRLTKKEMAHLKVGYSLFAKPWVQAPSSTKRRDGLGPHFNAVSCMSCHNGMGRGAPPGVVHPGDPALVFKSNTFADYHQYGDQITPKALPKVTAEAKISVHYEKVERYGREVLRPHYTFRDGSLALVGTRIAPHLAGLGKLESIPADEIFNNTRNGGQASLIGGTIARFGWKASQKDLAHQVAAAFSKDMGITNYQYPHERCESDCGDALSGADEEGVEIRKDHLHMVVTLMKGIQPPSPITRDFHREGLKVFKKVNCQSCHRVSYDLGDEIIEPYSDLLLHDMGEGLADKGEQKESNALWRTPPLWGLGSLMVVNGHTRLLHDGRARNVEEAILWHGGEATPAVNSFLKLSTKERDSLLSFLNSL